MRLRNGWSGDVANSNRNICTCLTYRNSYRLHCTLRCVPSHLVRNRHQCCGLCFGRIQRTYSLCGGICLIFDMHFGCLWICVLFVWWDMTRMRCKFPIDVHSKLSSLCIWWRGEVRYTVTVTGIKVTDEIVDKLWVASKRESNNFIPSPSSATFQFNECVNVRVNIAVITNTKQASSYSQTQLHAFVARSILYTCMCCGYTVEYVVHTFSGHFRANEHTSNGTIELRWRQAISSP